jgi:hypothetical protein
LVAAGVVVIWLRLAAWAARVGAEVVMLVALEYSGKVMLAVMVHTALMKAAAAEAVLVLLVITPLAILRVMAALV